MPRLIDIELLEHFLDYKIRSWKKHTETMEDGLEGSYCHGKILAFKEVKDNLKYMGVDEDAI